MKTKITHLFRVPGTICFLTLLMILSVIPASAQVLTPGNIVVLQTGDGTAALSTIATPVFLKQYTPSGTLVSTAAIPVTGSTRLTNSGSATSEGVIARSADSNYVVISGYDAASGTASVAGTTSSAVPRVINTVDLFGTISRGAATSTTYSAGNIRSAVRGVNNDYWGAGSNSGTYYFGQTNTAATVQSTTANTRTINIYNGNLFFSTGSGTQGIYKMTGLPTAAATPSLLIGVGNPAAFAINPTETIAYIAIDAASGGVQKWTWSGTWTLAYTLAIGTSGTRGLAVDFSGANPVIYATTNGASANLLVKITDTGAGSTATTLATAPTNTVFRGVTFTPKNACVAPSLSAVITNATCNGISDGAIDLTTGSGSTPFSFLWSNGALTEDISSLAAGTYTVTVTAGGGCTSTASFNVTQPAPVPGTASSNGPVCAGLQLNLYASGGVSYNWSGPNGFTSNLQNPVINPAGIADSGDYTVVVTDAGNCFVSVTTLAVVQNCTCIPPNLSATTQMPSCFGGTNGAIDLTAIGGVPPYTFQWNNGAVTEDVSGLSAGVYSVIVTDFIACADTLFVTLGEPALITSSVSVTNPGCQGYSNGSIDLSVTGGTPGYTYQWDNGATTEDISGLSANLYSVTITDANGCTSNNFGVVVDPPPFTLNGTAYNVSCAGNADGAINITASNDIINTTNPGLLISEFLADPANTDSSKEWVELIATKFIDFSATPYTVVLSNNGTATINGWVQGGSASATTNGTFAFEISSGIVVPGDVVYVGGSNMAVTGRKIRVIDVSTTGGDGGIGLPTTGGVLGNGGTNADGIAVFNSPAALLTPISVPTDAVFFGSAMGNAVVAGGTAGFMLPVDDLYPGGFLQSGSYLAANPGTSYAKATGGYNMLTGLYTQRVWSLAASFTDNASDVAVGSDNTYLWSNGATTEDINGLASGTYSVTATTNTGCTAGMTFTISAPSSLSVTAAITHVSCYGLSNGFIDQSIVGGVTPYSFLWNDGDLNEDRSLLGAGTYTVIISDANGCMVTVSYTITQPNDITYITLSDSTSCYGALDGGIDLTVNGGTMPYTFLWSNGDITEDIINQPASFYTFDITDANGCVTGGLEFINEPNPILIGSFTPNTGGAGVLVTINGSGFTGINSVLFDGTPATSFSVINDNQIQAYVPSGADTGYISIGTSLSCVTISADTFFYDPSACVPPSLSYQSTGASCFGASDGSIDLTITGGMSPYTISWSNGATSEDITGLFAGTYTVNVLDAASCAASLTVIVSEPLQLTVTAVLDSVSCTGFSDGSIDITVNGGTSPYTYQWSNLAVSEDINGLQAGTYTVIIVDAALCATQASFGVFEPLPLSTATIFTDPLCALQASGTIDPVVSGGTPAYTYAWSNGAVSPVLTAVTAGTYTVTITDAKSCTITTGATLTDPPPFSVNATNVIDVTCYGGSTGAIDITASNDPLIVLPNPGVLISEFLADPAGSDLPFEWVELVATKAINFTTTPYTVVFSNNGAANTNGWKAGGALSYAFQISSGTVNPGDVFYVGGSSMAPTGIKLRTINTVTTAGDGFGSANGGGLGNGGANADGIAVFDIPSASITPSSTPVDALFFGTGRGTTIVSGGTAGYMLPSNDMYAGGFFSSSSFFLTVPSSISGTHISATGTFNTSGNTFSSPRSWSLSPAFTNAASAVTVVSNNIYQWSNGATTQDISSLPAGAYTLTATNPAGCVASATVVISQPNDLTITGFSPSSGITGTAVTIYGTGFTGVTTVEFNGLSTAFTIDNDGQISTTVPPAASSGPLTLIIAGCDTAISANPFGVITTGTLNLTMLIEGYFNGTGMNPVLFNSGVGTSTLECDTIRVELREQFTPTNVMASETVVMNTSGQATITLPGTAIGQNGYIAVFHRNAVQTWSDLVTFNTTTNYNFTTADTQAYGLNMIQVMPGTWAFYSGDVDQDEFIGLADQGILDNDVFNFAGGYIVTDLDGDAFVGLNDQGIQDNNIFNFIGSSHP